MILADFADAGKFRPKKFAELFRTTTEDIAHSVGLGRDAVQRAVRINSDKTQTRLRELAEVIAKVEPRFGSELVAYAWYRAEPLSGFDGFTAMQLVKDGRINEVLDYIDAVDAGLHA